MKVYKYKEWNTYTKKILTDDEIFFPTREQLNDPSELLHLVNFPDDFFDSKINNANKKIKPEHRSLLLQTSSEFNQYIASLHLENPFLEYLNYFPNQNFKIEYDEPFKKYLDHYDTNLSIFEAVYDKIDNVFDALNFYALVNAEDYSLGHLSKQEVFNRIKLKLSNVGVLSLTNNPKSPAMWAYYAKNHSGIVLIFETENDPLFDTMKEVKYVSERPQIRPNNMDEITLLKHTDWRHENEYRVLSKEGNLVLPINSNTIVGVILGVNISSDNLKDIKETVAKCKKDITVYQAAVNLQSYFIEYDELT